MIRIRPYYLYGIFRQLAAGETPVEENNLPNVVAEIKASNFKEEIQVVHSFCDCCLDCKKISPDSRGSLWCENARCVSSETASRLNQVEDQIRSILFDLKMNFNDTMQADLLLKRAAEARPWHYFHIPKWQRDYEKGIEVFKQLTGQEIKIPPQTAATKKYFFMFDEEGNLK